MSRTSGSGDKTEWGQLEPLAAAASPSAPHGFGHALTPLQGQFCSWSPGQLCCYSSGLSL